MEDLETVYTQSKKREWIPISEFLTSIGHIGGIQVAPRVPFNWPARFVWGKSEMYVILINEHKQLWRLVQLEHE